jgi:hypothetical protein
MFRAAKLAIAAALVALIAVGAGLSTAVGHRGPAPVDLGLAGKFVILTKAGITNVPTSAITGNIGTSPITGAAITGLGCGEVIGKIFTVDSAGPPCRLKRPQMLTTAIHNMVTAYQDAAGRTHPKATELGAGQIGGLTIRPGLYKWSSGVLISTDVTLMGGPHAVWIFQIAGGLHEASAVKVHLSGGARAKNIFWQVAGVVTIGTTAHFKGIVLAKKNISPKTGAVITGRLFAQTAVTLKQNRVTRPL